MPEAAERVSHLEAMLLEEFAKYDFSQKRANVFSRNRNGCIQHISILRTKTKGKDQEHIKVLIGFTYVIVNKTIAVLRDEKYDSKWATANINLDALMKSQEPYGFYIDGTTDVLPIAENILQNILTYSFDFFNKCDSLDKYYRLLKEKDKNVCMSTYALKRPEWNLLALSVILKTDCHESILLDYQSDFLKFGFTATKLKEITQKINERMLKHNGS